MSDQNKTIHLQYYAILREKRGASQESIQTQATTAKQLYQELKIQHNFPLDLDSLKVAINDEFSNWDQPLKENDTITFIPPVAGG